MRDGASTDEGEAIAIAARSVTIIREDSLAATPRRDPATCVPAGPEAAAGTHPAVTELDNAPNDRASPTGVTDTELDHLAELAGIDPIWWDVDGGYHKVPPGTKQALLAAMRLPATTARRPDDSLARLTLEPRLAPGRNGAGAAGHSGQARPAAASLAHTAARGRQPRAVPDRRRHLVPAAAADRPAPPAERGPPGALLPPDRRARRLLPAAGTAGGQAPLRHRRASVFAALQRRSGHRRLHHARPPLDRGRPGRRRDHRPEPAARAVSARPRAGPARINRPTGAFWTRSISMSPASPAAPACRRHPVRWITRRSGTRKRAVLRAAFKPGRHDAIPPACGASPPSRRSRKRWEPPTGSAGRPNCAIRTIPASRPSSPQAPANGRSSTPSCRRLADQQLAAAAASASRDGLSLGFYRDLAVGAAPDGAEAWSAQDTLMHGVSVGAPPDPFSDPGPDLVPAAAQPGGDAAATATPRSSELLVANMRHAGALRIDHVMGLRRLFVVPDGAAGDRRRLRDLSAGRPARPGRAAKPAGALPGGRRGPRHRARGHVRRARRPTISCPTACCGSSAATAASARRRNGAASPPPASRRTTWPTLAGWWNGADIAEKRALGAARRSRRGPARADVAEKTALIALLQAEDLLTEDVDLAPADAGGVRRGGARVRRRDAGAAGAGAGRRPRRRDRRG